LIPTPTLSTQEEKLILLDIGSFIRKEKITDTEKIIAEQKELLLESIKQLNKLITAIPENKIRPVFAGYTLEHLGWPEVRVLGPTQNYFYDLFYPGLDFLRTDIQVICENLVARQTISLQRLSMITLNLDPCSTLKEESETKTTVTNLASIIFAIDDDEKRYLFTGDAGIESFHHIWNWKTELKNLFWLKVPHHGSANNLSKKLIELMNPIHAYSSGKRHQDDDVLKCIKSITGRKVFSTKDYGGDLRFP
jgi:hypothetical protein